MTESPTVLLIDDNRDLAENLREILEDLDIPADIAEAGVPALTMLEAGDYDLVITDLRMPDMDGIDVLRTINQRWPRLPVVIMSAYANDVAMRDAAAAGALEILSKPVDIEHMIGLVKRIAEPNAKILVLEDDDHLRSNLCEALFEITNAVPYPAPDVATAERLAAEVEFPIAIIDIRLPDGDGVTVGRALRARLGDQIALFYITGHADELRAQLATLLDSDHMHVLEKPFSPGTLISLIEKSMAAKTCDSAPQGTPAP